MGCTCHLMHGEPCRYCMEQIAELEAMSAGYEDEVEFETETLVFDTHHGRKMARHAAAYGMGAAKFVGRLTVPADPDGPPDGFFGRAMLNEMNASDDADYEYHKKRTESLRFIHQPAKSLREELRMGVHYDASGTE